MFVHAQTRGHALSYIVHTFGDAVTRRKAGASQHGGGSKVLEVMFSCLQLPLLSTFVTWSEKAKPVLQTHTNEPSVNMSKFYTA